MSFYVWSLFREPEVGIVLFTQAHAFHLNIWEGFFYSCGACVILLNVALRCDPEKSQDIQ